MKITLDDNAVMPSYAHEFDAGLDLYAKTDMEPVKIPPFGGFRVFDTGVHMAIPQHFCGLVKSRSGMLMKGLPLEAAALTVVTKLPATVFNAVVAIVFAPILAMAIRKALEQNHLTLD